MQKSAMSFFKMCLNPKAVVFLVAIGIAVAVLAPAAALRILPLLFLAACPLSMLLMSGAMMRGHQTSAGAKVAPPDQSEDELAKLRREVESLKAKVSTDSSGPELLRPENVTLEGNQGAN